MVRGSKKGYINKFLFAEYGKQAHLPFACCRATGQTEPDPDGQSLQSCLQLLLYEDDV